MLVIDDAGCGGPTVYTVDETFIGGSQPLIAYLRYTAPGFVLTGGLCPSAAGAALAAIKLLGAEPQRVEKCRTKRISSAS